MTKHMRRILWGGSALVVATLLAATGCQDQAKPPAGPEGEKKMTIGVSFETLQTEFWVAALDAFRGELAKRNITLLEAIANGDANRQLEQVRNFITRKVDGIIVVPKDSKTIIPVIKSANQAGIPIVLFNRPPDPSEAKSVTVVADNYAITRATVELHGPAGPPNRPETQGHASSSATWATSTPSAAGTGSRTW